MDRLGNINKKSILIYAGALTVLGIASFLLFTAIAGPTLQSAELTVSRYDINELDFYEGVITKRCPLSKEEEKRLGFIALTTYELNKVPKLKEAIEGVEKKLEELIDTFGRFWSIDSNGCYILTHHPIFGYYPTTAGISIKLTQSEYNSLKELIYNAYKKQHTQEELKRLAELYKGFHPSDEGINAYPTDILESQQSTKDYADMSTAYIGFFDAFIKYDDKYYRVSMRTIAK